MKLEIVSLWSKESFDNAIAVEPSTLKRKWMDESQDEYAYRCLPLNIANQHGWAIYPKHNIVASWSGDESINRESVKVYEDPENLAVSHFGHGILTFSLPFLVKLDPGYSLYITGAPNHHIKGIQPCTGVFEADWAPYSFTMNWRFTHANQPVVFTTKDPICFMFPVPRNIVNETETKYSTLEEQDEEYKTMYKQFTNGRDNFDVSKHPDGWEKNYFQGLYPDGTKCPFDHKTKLKPSRFE
jgi:hypothetical protein